MTTTTPSCVLITGANVGLGLECAHQLASVEGIDKILLTCRSMEKATKAKEHLERITNQHSIFDIVLVDVSNLESVKKAVEKLKQDGAAVDGVVLNAGGAGGSDPKGLTEYGVTNSIAANLLGHVLLIDELIKAGNLIGKGAAVVLSGSESARGVPEMSLPTPKLESGSVEELTSICDGSFWTEEEATGLGLQMLSRHLGSYSKFVGALWMSSMVRKHSNIRFVTMSPGATSGTTVTRDLPWYKSLFVRTVVSVLSLVGKAHSVQVGAKRYVDALLDHETYQSGVFYASKKGLSGEVCDQAEFLDYFSNESYQDNAYEAIHKFIKE